MMHQFNAKRMLYYNKIIISVDHMKIMAIFVSEIELKQSKINKHFILLPRLPDNDGMNEYTLPVR